MEKFGYVLATKKLVDERLQVGVMYREKGDEPDDSGWRFFSGLEDQDYVDNPDNIGIYDINTILEIDKSIRPYLDSSYGAAFERNEKDVFVMIEDYPVLDDEGEG